MTDNFFIAEYFDWKIRRISYLDRLINRLFSAIGIKASVNTAYWFDMLVEKITGKRVSPVKSGIMTNIEQRINMYHLVSQVLAYDVPGDIVELGCNEGQSSVLFQKLIKSFGSNKKLHVYDSFEGLPELGSVDGTAYRVGELKTSIDQLHDNFKKYDLPPPEIHKGWFNDTLPTGLPEKIAFAHLDGDLYDSILISLKYVYPRLTKGAICLIDDYCDPDINPFGWNELPGVKKACDDFLFDKPESVEIIYSGAYSHGFFRKV
jgi:O-methyltransferase